MQHKYGWQGATEVQQGHTEQAVKSAHQIQDIQNLAAIWFKGGTAWCLVTFGVWLLVPNKREIYEITAVKSQILVGTHDYCKPMFLC